MAQCLNACLQLPAQVLSRTCPIPSDSVNRIFVNITKLRRGRVARLDRMGHSPKTGVLKLGSQEHRNSKGRSCEDRGIMGVISHQELEVVRRGPSGLVEGTWPC